MFGPVVQYFSVSPAQSLHVMSSFGGHLLVRTGSGKVTGG